MQGRFIGEFRVAFRVASYPQIRFLVLGIECYQSYSIAGMCSVYQHSRIYKGFKDLAFTGSNPVSRLLKAQCFTGLFLCRVAFRVA